MPAAPKEEAGVKILSIHRSKGLEYSVVFLCGLGRRINYGDLQKPVLFHPRLGLGPKGLDRETMVEFTTLARTGVALALKKELLAEEMRLLYVAMTRAKEKLILTHALAYGRGDLRNLAESVSYPADPGCWRGAPVWVSGSCSLRWPGRRGANCGRPSAGRSFPCRRQPWGHPGALPTMAAGCPRGGPPAVVPARRRGMPLFRRRSSSRSCAGAIPMRRPPPPLRR
ncbi:MAG: 3'-5' exonuclease [Evtepia gabavorous]